MQERDVEKGVGCPVKWELIVFLFIVIVGFGLSIEKLMYPELHKPSVSMGVIKGDADVEQGQSNGNEIMTIDLGCLEPGNREVSQDEASLVKIRGRICKSREKFGRNRVVGLKVRNLTNGDGGMVYLHDAGTLFSSEAVGLSEGRNVLRIEWQDSATFDFQFLDTEIVQK